MLLYQSFFIRILLIFTSSKENSNYLLSKHWRLHYFSMTSILHFYVARLWDTRATASWFHPAKPMKYVVVGGQFWRRWKRRRRFGSEGFSCIHGKPSLLQSHNCFIALISEHNQLKFILVGCRWNEGFGNHGFILVYMLVNPWTRLTGGRNKLIDARQRSEMNICLVNSYTETNFVWVHCCFLFSPLFYPGLLPIPFYKIFHFQTFKDFPNLSTDLKLPMYFLSDRPRHVHSVLEFDLRFRLTPGMSSGGLQWVLAVPLMLGFLHIHKAAQSLAPLTK